MVKHVETR